mgnify:CR=1 FL=1
MSSNHDSITDKPISEILEAFRIFDGAYKREAIDAAIARKEEITPYLITILENVLADPQPYADDQDLQDHIYAVMLLGHFREQRAHRLIIDIFSLPDDLPHEMFGDISTGDLPTLLINTCGGSLEDIESMIVNRSVDDYCRVAAAQALSYAVVEGYADRKATVEFFGTLFTGDEAGEDSDFWGLIAATILYLYPAEIIDVLQKGYEDDLIFAGIIDYESFEEALGMGEAWCLERLRDDYEHNSLDDLHKAMAWWACFHPDNKGGPLADSPGKTGKSKKQKAKAKKKRKKAKASRKKNRRR